ncbi:Uncharacterised protein [Mycobacteroides abscessus subsp. abscessus]|nr:Uncharacterised protein [Mycobacteroides abscessus subsp. abscessus]
MAAVETATIIGLKPHMASLIPPPSAVIPASSSTTHTLHAATSPPARYRPCRPATAATTNTAPAKTAATRRAVSPVGGASATGAA